MGKAAPAPIVPIDKPTSREVDRKALNKITLGELKKRTGELSPTTKGDPQASLLAERKLWDEKEKKYKESLLKDEV